MVSRGGRSRGCTNCRRRRVKCDETSPVCIRCQKRGLECDGPKEQTWINQSGRSTAPNTLQVQPGVQMIAYDPSARLSLAAFEDDICLAYTRKTLLRGGPVELAFNVISLKSLGLDESPEIVLLRDAVMSLAVTFYGTQQCQPNIRSRGYRQYGQVLRQLNQHLSLPGLQTVDETILAALTCLLLEIFLPTGPNHFLKHMRGIEAMLDLRGPPPTSMSTTTHILFHGLRVLSVISGLAMARPALYSRKEWKQIPSLHTDEAGLLRHRLLDVLADCTRYLAQRDIVLTTGDVETRDSLIAETKASFRELENIHKDWVQYNRSQMDKPMSKAAIESKIANHQSATVYMLYNTTYICLLDILEYFEPSAYSASLRNSAAIKIIKSLEMKEFEKREGAVESNTVGFVATKVAWQALGGFNSAEGRKLARVVKKAVNGVFAVGAWETEPEKSPRLDPESPNRIIWNMWTENKINPSDSAYGEFLTQCATTPQAVLDLSDTPYEAPYEGPLPDHFGPIGVVGPIPSKPNSLPILSSTYKRSEPLAAQTDDDSEATYAT